jgi:GNAT superfamily N-acetyltransferase
LWLGGGEGRVRGLADNASTLCRVPPRICTAHQSADRPGLDEGTAIGQAERMRPRIRPFTNDDVDVVVRLSLRAWAPVFPFIEQAIGSEIYRLLTPDWRRSQRQEVEAICASETTPVWVGEIDATIVGFVAVTLHRDQSLGEIYMLAVDPDYQRIGVGTALTTFALAWIKSVGMSVAMVETGADPGHAPARRTYEKAGYRRVPVVRYFKKL